MTNFGAGRNWSNPDRDGDGLTNEEEASLGTDPDLWDTDLDTLSDQYEVEVGSERGSDPLKLDTDGDGLNDAIERRVGTRINVVDSDGDGLTDGQELRHLENGVLVGGWNIDTVNGSSPTAYSGIELISAGAALAPGDGYWVSSDPLMPDDDGDTLNA